MPTKVVEGGPTPATKRGRLLAVLGLGFGLALLVGNTIGSGILRTPGEVAAYMPAPALFLGVWLLGGVYALLGGNAIAELSAMTPRSGGYTVFVGRALGGYAGFLVGWTDWLGTVGASAVAAIVIAESVSVLSGGGAGLTTPVAIGVLGAIGIVQARGVRSASAAQVVTTVLKALAFGALIVAAFVYSGAPASAAGSEGPRNAGMLAAIVFAMQAVIFTYDGFSGPTYFAGELKDPGRDIPRSILFGVLSVAVIYLLLNVAFLKLVPLERMAGDPFVAASAARVIFGAGGDVVIRVITILSLIASLNAFQMMASRIFYAMSDANGFSAGASVNEGGTPFPALLVSSVAAALFIVAGLQKLLAIISFYFVLTYAASYLGVFVLRRREPDAPRPYRAWGHPWTTGIVLLGSVAFLLAAITADRANSVWALLLLVATWPAYRWIRGRSPSR